MMVPVPANVWGIAIRVTSSTRAAIIFFIFFSLIVYPTVYRRDRRKGRRRDIPSLEFITFGMC